jgi:prevent-host-death family protein
VADTYACADGSQCQLIAGEFAAAREAKGIVLDGADLALVYLTGQFNQSNAMKQIQASEAKAKFSELLDEVEQGETIVITRHGKIVARIAPDETLRREQARAAIEGIRKLREGAGKASVEEIIAWKNEGRE